MRSAMPTTLAESFELLIHAEQLAPRIDAAATALAQLPDLAQEKEWLAAARARLATARVDSHGDLLNRALRLPELESLKGERGKLLQVAVADELDRLSASITLAGSPRSPLLEMLFHNLKVPALRKCGRAEVEKFCLEIERRLTSSYAVRMFNGGPYVAVKPAVHALGAAIATWRSVFVEPPLDDKAAAPLRAELAHAGSTVELVVRQARLLAQAALLPAAELLDAAGVVIVKKGRAKDEDTHPILERDPPDPLLPTAAEREEIATVHAAS